MTAPIRRTSAEWDVPLAIVAADAAPDRQAFLTAAVAALAEHRAELPIGAVPDPHDLDPDDARLAAACLPRPEQIPSSNWQPKGADHA